LLGRLLDRSWDYYFYFMAPFGILGGTLMIVWLKRHPSPSSATAPATAPAKT
jgi:hypothetical protein